MMLLTLSFLFYMSADIKSVRCGHFFDLSMGEVGYLNVKQSKLLINA